MSADPDKQWLIDNARHLRATQLKFQQYARPSATWDHDHCAGCWARFSDNESIEALREGYTTTEDYKLGARYDWVCVACFDDLKNEMDWSDV